MNESNEAENDARCRVLLVEDYEILLTVRARNLRSHGFRVSTAQDADSALRLLAQGRFDVVVADLRLPGRDGIALLEEAARREPGIGRVLISGDISDDAQDWAAREGVIVVTKGVDPPDVLVHVVRAACSTRGLRG
jgi:two-component system C4-dicarboxylate transport response regulator DctD